MTREERNRRYYTSAKGRATYRAWYAANRERVVARMRAYRAWRPRFVEQRAA